MGIINRVIYRSGDKAINVSSGHMTVDIIRKLDISNAIAESDPKVTYDCASFSDQKYSYQKK